MLGHYTILRLDAAEHSILDATGAAPREGYSLSQANSSASRLSSRIAAALDGQREPDVAQAPGARGSQGLGLSVSALFAGKLPIDELAVRNLLTVLVE